MNYKDIKISTNEEYNTFIFNNQEIKVLKYLSVSDKFDLVMTAIQKSTVDGMYNPIRLNTFFKLNIMYLYTDITFDIEDRMDESALYDNLYQSGLITAVENAMDGAERLQLYDYLSDCLIIEKEYRTTAAAIISKLVDDLPKNAEATKTIVDTFDKEKFAEVMRFAQAINGGKPI